MYAYINNLIDFYFIFKKKLMNVDQTKKVTEFIMNQDNEITDLKLKISELNKYIKDLETTNEQNMFKISFFRNQLNMREDKIIALEKQCERHKNWVIDVTNKCTKETKVIKRIRDLLVGTGCMSGFDDDAIMVSILENMVFKRNYYANFLNRFKLKNMAELEDIIKSYRSIKDNINSDTPENENNDKNNNKDKIELFHYRIQDIVNKGFDVNTLYNIVHNLGSDNINKNTIDTNTPKNIIVENKNIETEKNNKPDKKDIELMHYRVKEIVEKGFNTTVLYDIINNNNKSESKNTPRKPKKPTNQVQIVDNIIRRIQKNTKLLQNKNDDYYDLIYTKNRKDIDFYTTIYNDKDFKDISNKIDIKLDKNTPRLDRTCGILNFIKNNTDLYNSEYIFSYYTFKSVNNTGLEYLYEKLLELCPSVESNEDNWESDTEEHICTVKNCNNYVPMEGIKCKKH